MNLGLRTNQAEFDRDLDRWADTLATVRARATNTLIAQADFAGRKAIRDIYGISTRDLAPYFEVELAATGDRVARIVAKGKGFPLRFFKPKRVPGTGGGVRVTLLGRDVFIPHAFIPSGSLGSTNQVFARGRYGAGGPEAARRRRGRRKAGLSSLGRSVFRPSGERFGRFAYGLGRFPITLLRSSSPPDALTNERVRKAMDDRVEKQAPKVLARELRAAQRGF